MLHGAGIFTNIYPINEPNVDKYTIPGAWSIWVFLNRQLGYLSFVEPDILWQLDTVNIRLLYLFHPNYLLGGIPTPLKIMSSSVGMMIIPYMIISH